jgi:hypothetical protein
MIFISILAGLLSSMNMWVVSVNHMRLHANDLYMAILMSGWMLVLESIFYGHYGNSTLIGVILVAASLLFIRKQILVDDKQFLNGMIPHHSMAILMSESIKNKTKDPRIKQLAEGIIKAQRAEISIMSEYAHSLN